MLAAAAASGPVTVVGGALAQIHGGADVVQ